MFGFVIATESTVRDLREQIEIERQKARVLRDLVTRELPKVSAVLGLDRTERQTWTLRLTLDQQLVESLERGTDDWRQLVAESVAERVVEAMVTK